MYLLTFVLSTNSNFLWKPVVLKQEWEITLLWGESSDTETASD